MLEENVVRAAGVTNCTTEEELRRIIRDAGFKPAQRDTLYRTVLPELESNENGLDCSRPIESTVPCHVAIIVTLCLNQVTSWKQTPRLIRSRFGN